MQREFAPGKSLFKFLAFFPLILLCNHDQYEACTHIYQVIAVRSESRYLFWKKFLKHISFI